MGHERSSAAATKKKTRPGRDTGSSRGGCYILRQTAFMNEVLRFQGRMGSRR